MDRDRDKDRDTDTDTDRGLLPATSHSISIVGVTSQPDSLG